VVSISTTLAMIVVAATVPAACGSDGPDGSGDGSATSPENPPPTDEVPAFGGTTRVPGADTTAGGAPVGDADGGATSTPRADEKGDSGATAPTEVDRDAVLAAVDCYFDTIIAANNPPNPQHEGYDRCFTGAARTVALDYVTARRDRGEHLTDPNGTVLREHEATQRTAAEWVVRTCVVDDAILWDESGLIVDGEIVTLRVELTVVAEGGMWKVSNIATVGRAAGNTACPAS
jgi:hypothetical protein